MDFSYFLIIIVSLGASFLTFISGFGLGTLLTPVFALFFPLPIAIAMTAVVHLLNNFFKLSLTWKDIDSDILLKFGIPAIVSAYLGASLLKILDTKGVFYSYTINNHGFEVSILGFVIGVLMIIFALWEIVPFLKKASFAKDYWIVGGLVSGFFGGLSGHQGALRSAFLIKSNITKSAYIATGIGIACFTDISRLIVYGNKWQNIDQWDLVAIATCSAFVGAFFGKRWLKNISLQHVQTIVSILLLLIGSAFCMGIL